MTPPASLAAYRMDIARSYALFVAGEGADREAKAKGAHWKWWMSAGEGEVLPMCALNEAAGWLPIERRFPTGHTFPPGHLEGCRCQILYRRNPPNDELLERTQLYIRQTKEAVAAAV